MKVCIFPVFNAFLRSLNSGSVHTNPCIFENGEFILRLNLPPTRERFELARVRVIGNRLYLTCRLR